MKKVVIFTVFACLLVSCYKIVPHKYFIFVQSAQTGNITIEYALNNNGKSSKRSLPNGIASIYVEAFECDLTKKRDCPVSVLNETDSVCRIYASLTDILEIDNTQIDLVNIWHHAQKGETIGNIGVDSIFRYLKNSNNKNYYEVEPSNSYFTFQMP